MSKVLILANDIRTVMSFRMELIEKLVAAHDVVVSLPYDKNVNHIVNAGCTYIPCPVNRRSTNPIGDILLIMRYLVLIRMVKPDIILTYTVKPNIYGSIAARMCSVPSISTVTGTGVALLQKSLGSKLLSSFYRYAMSFNVLVFFQNKQDMARFASNSDNIKAVIVPGSGVNLAKQCYEEYPGDDKIVMLFVGRVMKSKGIDEYISAAREIRQKHHHVEFHVVGVCEDAVYNDELETLNREGVLVYHGQQQDVHSYMRECHCVVLPSYSEGMANVLLEAAATGRPTIASDIPGCREAIDDGITGLLCKPRDTESLVDALDRFLQMRHEDSVKMGKLARAKMEREFDRNIVVDRYAECIESILRNKSGRDQ
ncbi:MAG: glycosyltransferase family 4 protein [Armatimonadota bacterium]